MENIDIEKIDDRMLIVDLEKEWRKSLTFPNDDFDEAMLSAGQNWIFKQANETIGYACVDRRNTLIQFFIEGKHLNKGSLIFPLFLKEQAIKKARVGTHNPICLSLALQFQKSVLVDGYLFKDMEEVDLKKPEGNFRMAEMNELDDLVDFSHRVLEAPKDWLKNYISNWIKREEFFVFEREHKIVGTGESRTCSINREVASLGIVVCPDQRNQGIGTYLLGKVKSIAKSRNKQAICGCSRDNISSQKAIEKNGFRIIHPSLTIQFD